MARPPSNDTASPTASLPTPLKVEEVLDPAGAIVSAITLLVRAALARPVESPIAGSPPEPWLTTTEGARHASVSEETLREWITLGLLPAGRCGRVLRVRRSDIDRLLLGEKSNETPPANGSEDRAREILGSLQGHGRRGE